MNILAKLFIKDYKNLKDPKVRKSYGVMAGVFGIITNVILSVIKIITGIFVISPAIVADGINNFTDSLSSIITIIGFKVSNKKADKRHPFGHQRFEYITGLIIAFIILAIGFSLTKESVIGLYHLVKGEAEMLVVNNAVVLILILVFSIIIKLLQAMLYNKVAKTVDSISLKASAKDSLNDLITTFSVLISTVVFIFTKGKVNIDSLALLIVAIFIILSSIDIIKNTVSPLLGELPTDEQINKITQTVLSYEGILGVHDLIIHSYGPSLKYATLHAEVSSEVDVMESHNLIDKIERDIKSNLDIDLTIHMDPVLVHDELTNKIKHIVKYILLEIDPHLNFHDFRVVNENEFIYIYFDVVMPEDYRITPKALKELIIKKIKERNNSYIPVIQIDQLYNTITD